MIVSQAARLRFHVEAYTWENKYEGGHSFKKRLSKHQGRQ